MEKSIPKSLHRLRDGGKNDWDGLADNELNKFQKLAKKSKGILTAANAVTIASTVVVLNGLSDYINGQKMQGIFKIFTGRLGDVGDGIIAEATGTKGRFGRSLDPSMDFVQLGVALPMLVQGDVMPLIPAVAIATPKAIDATATMTSVVRGHEMNPTSEGKRSIAMIWAGIGAFMVKHALNKHAPGMADVALEAVGWAGTLGGAVYHLPATKEYVQIALGSKSQSLDSNR
mgnify:CR=1 FL=1